MCAARGTNKTCCAEKPDCHHEMAEIQILAPNVVTSSLANYISQDIFSM